MKIYTVYDSKAEAYLTPFFLKTDALAMREIETAVNTADHQFNKYPGDYTLYRTGS